MYARQHSPIPLQVTSSNCCEAWNTCLKRGSGLTTRKTGTHGIFDCVRTVYDCTHDIDNNVWSAEIEAKIKRITLTKTYPSLALFPFDVQKLTALEQSKVAIRFEQQMSTPTREQVNKLYACNCLFSCHYQFPYQHIFHIDRASMEPGSPLISSVWHQYFERFGHGGMEVF